MKKIIKWSVISYILFGLFIAWYLFYGANTDIPTNLKGSAADPETFMNDQQLLLSEEYSQIKNLLYFLSIPFEWLIYIVVLVVGLSAKFREWSKATSKFSILQTAIYLFWLSLIVEVLSFPFQWVSYSVSKKYNITVQTTSSWMKDNMIDFWVNYAMMIIIIAVVFWLIRKSTKRWWFYAWLLSVPFSFFLMFVQPVLIDPLYNDFYPLTNKELETKILALADKADIPADHVYEVNMSAKTNSLNAYVTGVGSNSRIVLWDTTLNRLSENEILFIMAHEMGHYVMKHIYIGIAGYLVLTLIGLYIINKLMQVMVKKWGKVFKVSSIQDIAVLPLFLLLISMLSFASDPISNAVSRHQEKDADLYALEMTNDKEAAVSSFQELSRAGLSQVNPPYLVKLFRYGHPTMLERLTYTNEYEQE
ncbi:M48 family metallopeptidase [Ferdinandcohnia quinoae]|uniref:M48 family metallopeptidase n=1 Tax=Fredinandcohnia quinoae TaxID=2918902 RepID=A0AAW5EA20_9BACI|nr:M48 family metallopeptidase [Fredinandcohnia sp. SECRCQ15]